MKYIVFVFLFTLVTCTIMMFFPLSSGFLSNDDLIISKYYIEISIIMYILILVYMVKFKKQHFNKERLAFIIGPLIFILYTNYIIFLVGIPRILHFLSSENIKLSCTIVEKGRVGKSPNCLILSSNQTHEHIPYCIQGFYEKKIYDEIKIGEKILIDTKKSNFGVSWRYNSIHRF